SRRHTYLQFVNSRILCCDLGSRTGTHGADELRARTWLTPREPIYVGPLSIRIAAPEVPESMPDRRRASGPDRPNVPAYFSFVNARNRAGRRKAKRIKRDVTLIGWSRLCNVRLRHSSVGRVHCSLVWTPTGLWVVDLLCSGGTRVNGAQVPC